MAKPTERAQLAADGLTELLCNAQDRLDEACLEGITPSDLAREQGAINALLEVQYRLATGRIVL